MDHDDLHIIEGCRQGDEGAFEALVNRYKERAYWIAYDIVGDQEAAKDIAQEAFVRVFRKIKSMDVAKGFLGWFSKIVVNLSIDHLRARRREKTVSLEHLSMEPSAPGGERSDAEARDTRESVRKVLERMPEKYRVVLALKEINGMSSEEIGKALGRPAITIRWRLHTARKIFKDIWERTVH